MSNIEASNPNAAGILEGFDRMIREAKLAGDQKEVDIIMEVRNRYCELLVSDEAPSNAARCEGCANLRDQLRDLARQSNLDAMRVGKLAEDVERYSALHARLFVEKTAAQIDAENMRELLYRMLEAPTTQISPSWKEEIRPALVAPGCKTPDGCRDNGAPARTMPKDQR